MAHLLQHFHMKMLVCQSVESAVQQTDCETSRQIQALVFAEVSGLYFFFLILNIVDAPVSEVSIIQIKFCACSRKKIPTDRPKGPSVKLIKADSLWWFMMPDAKKASSLSC